MSTIRLIETKAQTGRSLHALVEVINAKIRDRGHNATGTLIHSNAAVVSEAGKVVLGLGYAMDYWVNAGSGTPPSVVDYAHLVRWAEAKGLGGNQRETLRIAAAVRRKIRREGSKDYREGNPNIYLESIDEFEQADRFLPTDGAEKDALRFVDETLKNFN